MNGCGVKAPVTLRRLWTNVKPPSLPTFVQSGPLKLIRELSPCAEYTRNPHIWLAVQGSTESAIAEAAYFSRRMPYKLSGGGPASGFEPCLLHISFHRCTEYERARRVMSKPGVT